MRLMCKYNKTEERTELHKTLSAHTHTHSMNMHFFPTQTKAKTISLTGSFYVKCSLRDYGIEMMCYSFFYSIKENKVILY